MSRLRLPQDWTVGDTLAVFATVASIALLWYARPWYQWFVYDLYEHPTFALGLVIAVAVAIVVMVAVREVVAGATAFGAIFVVVIIVSSIASGWMVGSAHSNQVMAEKADVDDLIEVDADHPRILTRAVSVRYAENTLRTPRYQAVGGHLTVYEGTAYWAYDKSPDGLKNYFSLNQDGVILVNMETQSADVQQVGSEMRYGMGVPHWKAIHFNLLKQKGMYFAEYERGYPVVHEGRTYYAIPYTVPDFSRSLWFPPAKWGGVVLVDDQGTFTDLSPEEAQAHPVLEGQRLVPLDLVRTKVAATRYRGGIANQHFLIGDHIDQPELAPVPGANNDQPFFIQTVDGPMYVVALEPYGDSYGLKEVWMVDARTEAYYRYVPSENKSLFGPERAARLVEQDDPFVGGEDAKRRVSEPLPVVVDGELYWQIRVEPVSGSAISYITFVHAETTDLTRVQSTDEVRAFLAGEVVPDADHGGEAPSDSRVPVYVVQRLDENGTVIETMYVYDDESVVIVTYANETAPASEEP